MRSLINHLRFSRKFALIGALAFLLFIVPTTLLVRSNLQDLAIAEREQLAVEPGRDLLLMLKQMQQHRGLSALYLSDTNAGAADRAERQKQVEATLERVRTGILPLQDKELMESLERVASQWRALAQAVSSKAITGAQSNLQHAELIALELDLIDQLANSSGLALEAEAALFYVQRAVMNELPQLTEALGQTRARGAVMLGRGQASAEERARLENLADRARRSYDSARKSLTLAAGRHALPANLERARAEALKAAEEGFKLADSAIIRADNLSMPAPEWVATMTRIIDTQFVLVNASFDLMRDELQAKIPRVRNELLMLCALLGLLAAAALWVMVAITRATTSAINDAVRLTEAISAGDLTQHVQINGSDEVARLLTAMQAMTARLSTVVSSVRSNSESVATASAQIAQGNADLSKRTEEQASALQQTAASMEELGSTVAQNADGARQAGDLAREAAHVAGQGGQVVQQVVQTMQGLHASSDRISDIIGVIDGIAFQTNILALNAAVEAARAGEQGRGFAVVATEVRSLAQRSATAAREIKELITASVEQVGQGTQLADQAGKTMEEIVTSIRRVSDIMVGINAATAEQNTGIAQVGQAVTQMDTTTQQNAALVEESAAAAISLSGQARELVQAVAVFRLGQRAVTV
ncbi:HAMP domain-containing protein [Herbaspirillum seropedicae]|uniref:Methyl-accepting chemotaxis I protein n=1 Tax=Herbaspirillum seropedicae (strain SmR1) TaxID=757424 RepID=D8IQB2_HERSS|nr:methyl-accepting chemotaxis protein [Herbaspirillum seropedicae]ADJ65024.1 methyl-accepting chemotaxis I protein [Herbaspirillum seropedicae SmR1]AKN66900.1 chemotaxis protein [Herbaspirillum seropedicae]AON55861.1 methyl-accepting chemotaxis I protein [Herbaspirillum seropedicae]NQE28088.1 chemotaxis protein [Herbaspirillum seropedicae]UMU22898.1 HAMP domain-containing protein [Herbaspirillum seropedicae]